MKSVCRLGTVEFGFKVFSFQFHPLDLILTNHHGKVIRTDTIPGISDHDIVYTEFDLRPVKLQQKPRTIPLYNKANWYRMKIDLQNIKHTLSNMFKDNDCQVTNMWNVFKGTITKSAVKHIPQKRTKVKDSRPWINTEILKKSEKAKKTIQAEKEDR
jgi:hypothetical protein